MDAVGRRLLSWHQPVHRHRSLASQPPAHILVPFTFSGDALLIDGQLFSPLLPDDLRQLPMPPRGASAEEKAIYERAFNLRARWRYVRHAGPDADGATRWRCPFCAGLLRSRAFPKTMRGSRRAALVAAAPGTCCSGTLTAQAAELPLWQSIPVGTTAWRISMGRRQVAESANAALQGAFVDVGRGFVRVMGRTKITVLLAFTIAAYNTDRIRAFSLKHRIAARDEPEIEFPPVVTRRTTRRLGTWRHLLGGERPPD